VTDLFLYDDRVARGFEPFALTRPMCELRAGVLLLRERWEHALGMRAAGVITSPELAGFDEPGSARTVTGKIPAGSVLANSRCAVALQPTQSGDVWRSGDRVAAVLLAREVDAAELARSDRTTLESFARPNARVVQIEGRWIDEVWDFISSLSPLLIADIRALASTATRTASDMKMVSGSHGVFVEDGATVEPQVYFDATAGPILVRRGATVQAFTRIVGPCSIGMESIVGGDKIATSSVGDVCKVHGEVNTTIFLGHCNKPHDGFVGCSYLGRWVNLGAGTTTSNLKNTYGSVRFWTLRGERDSGQQFLGTFFGDHAKTGIGTILTTGSVVGAGANIYGGGVVPKVVPPFAWGDKAPYSTYRMDKFIEVARRVMERRHVELTGGQIRVLQAAFDRRWKVDEGGQPTA
jgi:UDP-N-acetylglucosamine diphosphorylase/glucosamine-1-phosphate N-acetyltransferase